MSNHLTTSLRESRRPRRSRRGTSRRVALAPGAISDPSSRLAARAALRWSCGRADHDSTHRRARAVLTAAAPTTGVSERVDIMLSRPRAGSDERLAISSLVLRPLQPAGDPIGVTSGKAAVFHVRGAAPGCLTAPARAGRGRAGSAFGPRPTERRPRRAELILTCLPSSGPDDPRHDVSRRPRVAPTASDPTTRLLGRPGLVRRLLGEPRAPLAEFRLTLLNLRVPRHRPRVASGAR